LTKIWIILQPNNVLPNNVAVVTHPFQINYMLLKHKISDRHILMI